MKRLVTFLFDKFLVPRAGLKEYQAFFYKIYQICLIGMNYGNGDDIEKSGEIEILKYVKGQLKERCTIFDVGANTGQFASNILKIFSKSARILSFEPLVTNYDELVNNLKNNKNIRCFKCGFGDVVETRSFFSNSSVSELASLYNRRLNHFNLELNQTTEIQLTTIERFCNENNITEIGFLKLDIEGHEYSALRGCGEMLKNRKINFIQFEFGGTCIDAKIFFQDFWYLLNEDYNIYRVVKDGLFPIRKYAENLEIFSSINYLAELK